MACDSPPLQASAVFRKRTIECVRSATLLEVAYLNQTRRPIILKWASLVLDLLSRHAESAVVKFVPEFYLDVMIHILQV